MEQQPNSDELYRYDDEFRDTIATVDSKGKRIWLFPKMPHGTLQNWRRVASVALLALLFSGPFLKIGGQPLLLINIFERRFVVLGQVFWPQDFVLLAITLITFFVFVILFTVVFGRIWCGWMCPQTLFMEMVFRKIEYWIEGDAPAQRKLNSKPWNFEKIWKKGLKQTIFFLIAVLIAHTAMAYMIGIEQTVDIVQHSPSENPAGFTGLLVFSVIFYAVFAYFREQACIAICPYGRLQGVLLTKDSIVVAYDWLRGEPRRKLKIEGIDKKGDCIDCKLCVHVCPTGIDIRNGTQLECVNCTACIDACDDVMTRLKKPKGLIRYASYSSIKNGVAHLFTPRVMGYMVVLTVLIVFLSFNLATRSDVETNVFKVPGTLFQRNDDGSITNLFNVEFVNKTFKDLPLTLKIESPAGAELVKPDGKPIVVQADGFLKTVYFVKLPAANITASKTNVVIGVYEGEKRIETVKLNFIGPITRKPKP